MSKLNNLLAEMKRNNVKIRDLMNVTSSSQRTIYAKTHGQSAFTIDEAFRIRDELFPGLRLEYLFQRDAAPPDRMARPPPISGRA